MAGKMMARTKTGPQAQRAKPAKGAGKGKGKKKVVVRTVAVVPRATAARFRAEPKASFALAHIHRPIPTMFADGKWAAMTSNCYMDVANSSYVSGVGTDNVARVLAIVNDGRSSNMILDFGLCNDSNTSPAAFTTIVAPVFPNTIGAGLTSSKSGRNGVTISLGSSAAFSAGLVYVVQTEERESLSQTPTQAQVFAMAVSLIGKGDTQPYSADFFSKPRTFYNTPRSATTYGEFEPWDGQLSAASHLSCFVANSTARRAYPMTTTYLIFNSVAIPAGSAQLPGQYRIKATLQLGTRWDADHPMSNTVIVHPTVPPATFNDAVRAGGGTR